MTVTKTHVTDCKSDFRITDEIFLSEVVSNLRCEPTVNYQITRSICRLH